jgi:hypothetical protein
MARAGPAPRAAYLARAVYRCERVLATNGAAAEAQVTHRTRFSTPVGVLIEFGA